MKINTEVIANNQISIQAKGIYAYFLGVCNDAGEVSILTKEMIEDLNISEPTFRKFRDELEEHGVIEKESFKREKNRLPYVVHKIIK